MPIQLPSFKSDVSDDVKQSLQQLADAVNRLEPHMQATAHHDVAAELTSMRQQLESAVRRIDDLTRRVRALEP